MKNIYLEYSVDSDELIFIYSYQSSAHMSTYRHTRTLVQCLIFCVVCYFFTFFFFLKVPPTNTLLVSSADTNTPEEGVRMIFVHENSSISFTCLSIGSRPGSRISWNLGNMEIIPKDLTYMNAVDESLYDTESRIQIRPQKNNHKQVLKCSTALEISVIHRRKAMLIVYG